MDYIIRDVLSGNVSAFCEIVKNYEDSIYNYLYRLCGSREDALDLTQETFIKAYNNLHRFRLGEDFRPWIYRIAHNSFIDHMRLKKEHIDIEDDELPDFNTPEDTVIARDTMSQIDAIIDSLPPMYKSVFLLRVIDGLSFKEVGNVLKITEASARMRYLRVRKKIACSLNGGEIF